MIDSAEIQAGDKLHIRAIVGDKQVNGFMQAADLRPDYKVYATQQYLVATLDGSVSDLALVCEGLLHAMQAAYIVAALQCVKWTRGAVELPCSELTYTNPQIREISDGNRVYFVPEDAAC
jgi:hypothetical protein